MNFKIILTVVLCLTNNPLNFYCPWQTILILRVKKFDTEPEHIRLLK